MAKSPGLARPLLDLLDLPGSRRTNGGECISTVVAKACSASSGVTTKALSSSKLLPLLSVSPLRPSGLDAAVEGLLAGVCSSATLLLAPFCSVVRWWPLQCLTGWPLPCASFRVTTVKSAGGSGAPGNPAAFACTVGWAGCV